MTRIAIIGAGITGVTTAYTLCKRGYDVVVFDRHRYPAMETSFANGGQLSASNAEVWNHPGTIVKGLRWMLQKNAPLLFNPKPGWHKYSWMLEFMANIRHHRSNTIETTRLAIAAREHLFRIAREEQIDFDLVTRGILHLYHTQAEWQAAERGNKLLQAGGLERFAVTPQEMQAIEPALQGRSLAGGYYTPSDATGDIHKFTRGLAMACERHGVRFALERDITGVSPHGQGYQIQGHHVAADGQATAKFQDTIDAVVVCAGTQSRRFAHWLGDRINIYPVKGYSITVHLDDATSQAAAPTVSLLDESAKIVTSRLGNDRFRVAGTAEFNGENRDIRADRVAPLVHWTRRLFPQVQTERITPWAGLRPMTPSMMPRVGAGRRPGVFYNTGHGHLGWTLSCATAEILGSHVDQHFVQSATGHRMGLAV